MRTVTTIVLNIFCLVTLCTRVYRADAQAPGTSNEAHIQSLALPQPNACQSLYDTFYQNEPGVYAYWPLCEDHPDDIGLDYLGAWPLAHGFTHGMGIHGGVAGPVPDNETAAQTVDDRSKLEQQGIFLNKNAGTLATWINASATSYPITAESLSAIGGKSIVSLDTFQESAQQPLCFRATLSTSTGATYHAERCAYHNDHWHRVAMVWNGTILSLYVNGTLSASTPYSGALDDAIYYYQLFPGCCDTGKQMSLAKALISNRAWTAAQVAEDFTPHLTVPPSGGAVVLSETLGTIHRDVLGYVDTNQDLSPAALSALMAGLKEAGVTALRYTGGGFPDADDWRDRGVDCTATPGATTPSRTGHTGNTLQHYMDAVVAPLHLDVDLTVNYGSNPPACDGGGDPERNAADLVAFANREHRYGIRHWEIGNEQYSYGGPNIDLHPNPYFESHGSAASTYTSYEPDFYQAMKTVDPAIEIAVPSAGPNPGYDPLVHYQIPLLKRARFDALVLHSYPLTNPITDGATLYPDRIASGTQVRGTLRSLQTQLLNTGKSPEAIWVTEWNAEMSGNRWSKQTMGAAMPLFVAMQLAEYMQAGVEFASWQAQGESDVCSTYNYDPDGESTYSWWDGCGDTALVYTGPVNDGEKQVGLRPGDLTPAARGFQILSQSGFISEGERMLRVQKDSTNAPWLAGYAATHHGSIAVLLINRDQDNAHTIPVRFAGKEQGLGINVWSYGKQQYDRSRGGDWHAGPVASHLGAWHGSVEVSLPPLSVNVLVLQ